MSEADQRLLDIAARGDAEEGIRQGLEDSKQGKVRPARKCFKDFEARKGIFSPPRDRRKPDL
jgi:hypothetical protein